MVGSALNVSYLIFGLSTDFNESCLQQILSENRLSKLEEIKVSKSSNLAIGHVFQLIELCPNLKIIQGLEYLDNISQEVSNIT